MSRSARASHLVIPVFLLGLVFAPPAIALDAPAKSVGPHAELGGKKPVTISRGPLSVTLRLVKARGGEAPVATVSVDGARAIVLGAGLPASSTLGSHARIVTLDATTPLPQVVFSRYTGGAHCCAETFIATQSGGKWVSVNAGTRDGEEGFAFEDIDGDGNVELTGVDNRFLYAFDSYAGSLAPSRIYRLRGTSLVEVTRDPRFQPWLRAELARQEREANENPESWKSNGFLAGWVAQKALLGETTDAWSRMLKNYDRASDWGALSCESKPKQAECADPERRAQMFPRLLRAFLVGNGYLAANDPAAR